jgi:hypothetical protein
MSTVVAGVVKNGVVVPQTSLPEGARVEIRLDETPLSSSAPLDKIESRFQQLAQQWRSETAHLSNVRKKALHPAYQEIIGMGEPAVPLILAEMKRQPGQWFWALHAITRDDPVAEESRGNLAEMTEAWLEWGRKRGHNV